MKKGLGLGIFIFLFFPLFVFSQRQVSEKTLEEVYEKVKTPYKYGLVLAPEDNHHKMDCPTVFRYGNKWYMTYVVYNGKGGQDGRGYETWMAESKNLLKWKILGRILSYHDGYWDCNQRGGFPQLQNPDWNGDYTLQKFKDKYWMTYIGGSGRGYEAVNEPLSIGLAWTEGDISKAHEWESLDKPVLSYKDKKAQWWEKLTQYKSYIFCDEAKTLGYRFVMYYNAGGVSPDKNIKGERIGIALSNNMKHWKRYKKNPVFSHEIKGMITGDAYIKKMGDLYVMFYFSAFNPAKKYFAYNSFACSYDLVHWTEWKGPDLIYSSKDYDELFAHKSYVVNYKGVVYHFYCAVNKHTQRGIALATSRKMGQSEVHFVAPDPTGKRKEISLNKNWNTTLISANQKCKYLNKTIKVDLPHNWDDYFGARQLVHGNLHGTAVYNKSFSVARREKGRRYFLKFQGVGTYAEITLNGKKIGRYPVGRTCLTCDVTDYLKYNAVNHLEVKAEHPEMITDMPWVCGGCSSEWGFSEGSQPLGIFRPVTLEETSDIRIEPFGVHVWNDKNAKKLYIETEIKNYTGKDKKVLLVNKLATDIGAQKLRMSDSVLIKAGETKIFRQESYLKDPVLWSIENPYMYNVVSMLKYDKKTQDLVNTPYGVRTVSWPVKRQGDDGKFYLNNKPVFINGICEYEHLFGQSHAFSHEQIKSRIKQVKNAGFNAFRAAHQPHNLEYKRLLDKNGILFWPQFSAHIWYDTPEFRNNFKRLLREWVKERRNSPSVIMWGLQNESVLPEDFARECSDIIREMDPTAVDMRPVVTCNGGTGTDWNVIQNWSGTYGGNPDNYNVELSKKDELLNGEYGAWRTVGYHLEPGADTSYKDRTETYMCSLLEKKIALAEAAKDSVCGQFLWVLNSHDNPGRRQPDGMLRKIDKVGPFNYKGLMTPWEQPTDAYYLYRSLYVSPDKNPMVYIVSHTWHDRFKTGERKATIEAYSNCDSVLLYNDAVDSCYLGTSVNKGFGHHFVWKNRYIKYNVLRAVGYYKGKPVCYDMLINEGLDKAPDFDNLYKGDKKLLKPAKGYNYVARINCGGDKYKDTFGNIWLQDNRHISHSWADDFDSINPYQASCGRIYDPVQGTKNLDLFQTFRFGRHKLNYSFDLPDERYRIELYFTEPWHGTGSGGLSDFEGLRIFDVAVNDSVMVNDLDIWAQTGHAVAYKRVVYADAVNGKLKISFPEVKAGEAVISAIAISSKNMNILPLKFSAENPDMWKSFENDTIHRLPESMLPVDKNERKATVYEAEKAHIKGGYSKVNVKKKEGILLKSVNSSVTWNIELGLANVYALRFKYMNTGNSIIPARLKIIAQNGAVLTDSEIDFQKTPGKWRMLSTTTGDFINAGKYKLVLIPKSKGLSLESVVVQ